MTPIPKVIDAFHGDSIYSFFDIAGAGVRAMIHKATEGATFADAAYAGRRKEAGAAGLQWGAYHFLRPGDMAGQAHFFLATANPAQTTRLAADYEDGRLSLGDLEAFCVEVEAHSSGQVTIYSYLDLLLEQARTASPALLQSLAARPLWLAHPGTTAPSCPAPWKSYWLWQYTGLKGDFLPGTVGGVDLNAFDGTDYEFLAQWRAAR